jgi:hypothetical protein
MVMCLRIAAERGRQLRLSSKPFARPPLLNDIADGGLADIPKTDLTHETR